MSEVRMITVNPWQTYTDFTYITIGKEPKNRKSLSSKIEEKKWFEAMKANHSTLRCVHFIIFDKLPKSVCSQLLRATKGHPQPEMESSRPDWTGKERSNDPYEPKLFAHLHTSESFIEMCKQRLCYRTEKNTRKAVYNWIKEMDKSGIPYFKALATIAMPSCVVYGACPEIKSCGFIERHKDHYEELRNDYLNAYKE